MKLLNKIIIICLCLILISGIIYTYKATKSSNTNLTYVEDNKRTLPTISIEDSLKYNRLKAYVNKDDIYSNIKNMILIDDEGYINLSIEDVHQSNLKLEYEIRDCSDNELIDKKNVDVVNDDGSLKAKISILDIFVQDRDYIIIFHILDGDKSIAYYGGKLNFNNYSLAIQMLELASKFSLDNFNKNDAKNNIIYMETDATKESYSLADVSLKNDFKKLIYNNLGLEIVGKRNISLLSYDGYKADISISFLAKEENGSMYKIDESFTMRNGKQRIYIPYYSRKMSTVLEYSMPNYKTGIALGVKNKEDISCYNFKNYLLINDDNGLYLFDDKQNKLTKIYPDYDQLSDNDYKIKVLKFDKDNIYFCVSGYKNYGKNAGNLNISLMKYDYNKLYECNSINVSDNKDLLINDINLLLYLNKNNNLIFLLGDTVYSVDDKNTIQQIITDIDTEELSVINNIDTTFICFKKKKTDSKYIYNLVEMKLYTMSEKYDDYDIVGRVNDNVVLARRVYDNNIGIRLYQDIILIDNKTEEVLNYKKDDYYIGDIRCSDNIISLNLLQKKGNIYENVGRDTIISKENKEDIEISSSVIEKYGKILYIKNVNNKNISIKNINKHIVYDKDDNNIIKADNKASYIVYVGDRCVLVSDDLIEATKYAYNNKGRIYYKDMEIYSVGALKTQKHLNLDSNILNKYLDYNNLISLNGIDLEYILPYMMYGDYIFVNMPDNRKALIYGFDIYNINLHYLDDNSNIKLGLNDAKNLFDIMHNNFWILDR